MAEQARKRGKFRDAVPISAASSLNPSSSSRSTSNTSAVVVVEDDDDDDGIDDVTEFRYWHAEPITYAHAREALKKSKLSANKPYDVKQVHEQIQQMLSEKAGNEQEEIDEAKLSLELLTTVEKFPHPRPLEIIKLLKKRKQEYQQRVAMERDTESMITKISSHPHSLKMDRRPIKSYRDEYTKLKDFTRKRPDVKPPEFELPSDLPFSAEPAESESQERVSHVLSRSEIPSALSAHVKYSPRMSSEENITFADLPHLMSPGSAALTDAQREEVQRRKSMLKRHRNLTIYDVPANIVLEWQKAMLQAIREKCMRVYEKVFDERGKLAYYITHIVPVQRGPHGKLEGVAEFYPANGVTFSWGGVTGSALSGLYHFLNDRKQRGLAGSHLCHRGTHTPVILYEDNGGEWYRWRVPCINPAHLTAESNTKNTARNGCPGMLRGCMHAPQCIAPSQEADSKGWYFRFGFEA